jgi:hypothetical protein
VVAQSCRASHLRALFIFVKTQSYSRPQYPPNHFPALGRSTGWTTSPVYFHFRCSQLFGFLDSQEYHEFMKIQRVYVDTSVIGGCLDPEYAPWSKGLIDDFRLGLFKVVLSDIIAAEIEDAPQGVQEIYAELLAMEPDFVGVTESALELADLYQQRSILTPKFYADGLHVALATVAEADLMVSWNFKHIVHFDKIRLFNAINLERGYKPLQIYSPREVTSYGEE